MPGCLGARRCALPDRPRSRNSIAERRRLPRLPERRCEAWFVSGTSQTFRRWPTLRSVPPRETSPQGAVHLRRNALAIAGAYLRAAQAYMLISMPTGTSTIFGVFQAISSLLLEWDDCRPQA